MGWRRRLGSFCRTARGALTFLGRVLVRPVAMVFVEYLGRTAVEDGDGRGAVAGPRFSAV